MLITTFYLVCGAMTMAKISDKITESGFGIFSIVNVFKFFLFDLQFMVFVILLFTFKYFSLLVIFLDRLSCGT